MRWLLSLWFLPITFLVLWLTLAANDWSLGLHFFSREMYDTVFAVYGGALGVPPESLPPLVVRALVLDSLIVLALYAFRRRKPIVAYLRERYSRGSASLESLSKAP
ncbi:hypothetical protein D3218_02960 [Aureimonas flava]|uniref:Uncharacterized protein n=1 Tax=Aureimonas flava TaxID=2320271 RepID=A0A3A1WRM2_9HYPH|nr:DUF6105 family protein [Aureimonas flava]RIY03714.1 hypothetical protein D3218_02960 [Aureimonas flava]